MRTAGLGQRAGIQDEGRFGLEGRSNWSCPNLLNSTLSWRCSPLPPTNTTATLAVDPARAVCRHFRAPANGAADPDVVGSDGGPVVRANVGHMSGRAAPGLWRAGLWAGLAPTTAGCTARNEICEFELFEATWDNAFKAPPC